MKKYCVALLLFISVSQIGFTQQNTFGVQVAPSYSFLFQKSDFEFVPLHGQSKITGLNIGAFYHFNLFQDSTKKLH
jgi:hypothetical protein